jgi:hypothetical protein
VGEGKIEDGQLEGARASGSAQVNKRMPERTKQRPFHIGVSNVNMNFLKDRGCQNKVLIVVRRARNIRIASLGAILSVCLRVASRRGYFLLHQH